MKISKLKTVILFSVFCFLFSFPVCVFAQTATLFFSPATGNYSVGDSFSANVYVSSPNEAVNAISGTITFPQDKIKAVSLSKAGSIINMWVQEPSFSNSNGTVNFEGIIPNPGFTGSSGRIITINFKSISSGAANVSFSSGSVLANDGNGTEILKGLGSASFSLVAAKPISSGVLANSKPKSETKPITIAQQSIPVSYTVVHPIIIYILFVIFCFVVIFLILYFERKISNSVKNIKTDIQRLKEAGTSERKELFGTQQNIKQLKNTNVAEDQELSKLNSKLENKTVLFEQDIDNLKKLYADKEQSLKNLELSIETRVENKTLALDNYLKHIQEINSAANKELVNLESSLESRVQVKTISLDQYVQQLKDLNTSKAGEILKLQTSLESELREKSGLFEKDVQQLRETNIAEEQELTRLGTKLEGNTTLLKRDIEQLEGLNSKKEIEMANFQIKLEAEMNDKTVILEKDVQQLRDLYSLRIEELEKIEQKVQDKDVLFEKDFQQLRDANSAEALHLADMESKLEARTALLEKDVQQIKEAYALKFEELVNIERSLEEKFEQKTSALTKNLGQIKEGSIAKEEELVKSEENLKTQMEQKIALLEKDIAQLKQVNTAKEEDLTNIRNSIKELVEDYKNISGEECELKGKISRTINSLRAFYANMILEGKEEK